MLKSLAKFKNKKKGFTLVELIVVIAIIAILAGILLPKYFGFTDQARQSAAISDAKSIRSIAETYYATYGAWPDVTVTGSGATKDKNISGTAGASISVLEANTAVASASTITSPNFQGDLSDFGTDGSFTYISDTGIEVTCDTSGTIEVTP